MQQPCLPNPSELTTSKPTTSKHPSPPIGRFFSLQQGRVGQFLSPRVLVVRHPFRSQPEDLHCFGFHQSQSAIRFAKHLAYRGYRFEFKHHNCLTQHPYEICISAKLPTSFTKTLAFFDRQHTQI